MNKVRPRLRKVIRNQLHVWYWGFDDTYGHVYGYARTEMTPHWCIRGKFNCEGYVGFDHERNRFVCRSACDPTYLLIGWRKDVYGPKRKFATAREKIRAARNSRVRHRLDRMCCK